MPLSGPDLAYHLRQYDEPYRSTEHLADFMRQHLSGRTDGAVIDFGCGAGANLHWFGKWGLFGGAKLVGIDQDADLLAIARQRNPSAYFLQNSIESTLWGAETSLSIQILSFVEDWRPLLEHMILHTARWLFVSSLFWDGIETHCHVGEKHYNVIDTRSFEEFARRHRAREVIWRDLVMDRNLSAEPGKMGAYTRAGMTFSGPLLMPWRFVAVRMA